MESHEAASLDRDFDEMLVDMKPYVLRLPHKSERQRCALWIKKFCEPQTSGLTGRKNRNQYAQLLLRMLKKGSLEGPFTVRPDTGALPTLPAYMSVYFDDTSGLLHDSKQGRVPDWVSGQLIMDLTGVSSIASEPTGPLAPGHFDARDRFGSVMTGSPPHTRNSSLVARTCSTSPINTFGFLNQHKPAPFCLDPLPKPPPPLFPISHENDTTSDDFTRHGRNSPKKSDLDVDWHNPFTSLSLGTTTGSLFRDEPLVSKSQERELEMRVKMIQAKFQEEKLKLQQKHDANVQKILDRKNSEIEDLKSHYRSKAKENEEVIAKLERKVNQLQKEWASVRDTKDTQLGQLKRLSEDTVRTQQEEADQRINRLTTAFEEEKFELQKSHTKAIQELLEDTNSRLHKMESEYQQQIETTSAVIRDLEAGVQQLTGEAQTLNDERNVLARDKMEAEGRFERLKSDLVCRQNRYSDLETEIRNIKSDTDLEIRSLKNKHDAHLTFMNEEHARASAKAVDTVADLQAQVGQLKTLLEDTEVERHRQIRELEHLQLQDKQHLEHLHNNKVKNLQQELEQANQDAQMKIRKLEQLIREKDDEVARLAASNRDQGKLAEQSLANFKRQVELNSSRMYDDMKKQMEKVESDLNRSKQLREKQTRELQKQLEEQRLKSEQKVAELKLSSERQLAQALLDTHAQKDQELDTARESLRNDLADVEQHYREKQNQDAKTTQRLEEEMRSLRDELLHSNQLRKQQLLELGQLREDEKQRMLRDHDEQMSQMRSYLDEQKLEMEKAHAAEVEDVLEKTNMRLKEIEKEFHTRNTKATENINELQEANERLREELQRHVDQASLKLSQTTKKFDDDKRKLKQQLTSSTMTLQEALEQEHSRLRQSERTLTQQQQWYEEQVVVLRGAYEDKIRGLIPMAIRQELEDTICSLKSQVSSLQQHAVILQEELDLVRHTAYASSHLVAGSSTTSTLIGSSLSLKTS